MSYEPLKAWSYSRYKAYSECPAKIKFQVYDKVPFVESDAMRKGTEMHKYAENYLKGRIKKLPKEFNMLREQYEWAKQHPNKLIEEEWAFDTEWNRVDWYGDEAWLRVKLDLGLIDNTAALAIDHKTGKCRPGYEEQLELSAIAMFHICEDVEVIMPENWYIDEGYVTGGKDEGLIYYREELPKLKEQWARKTARMLGDTEFKPQPSHRACNWCNYKASKGGPCKYG